VAVLLGERQLQVISPDTGEVIAQRSDLPHVFEVAFSPDRRKIYLWHEGPEVSSLTSFDVLTLEEEASIEIPALPPSVRPEYGGINLIAINDRTRMAYLPGEDGSIIEVNLQTFAEVRVFGAGIRGGPLVAVGAMGRLFVGSLHSPFVISVDIDPQSEDYLGIAGCAAAASVTCSLAYDNENNHLIAAHPDAPIMSVLQLPLGREESVVTVGAVSPLHLKLTRPSWAAEGALCLITAAEGELTVFDAATGNERVRISLGTCVSDACVHTDGAKLLLALLEQDRLLVYDTESLTRTGEVEVARPQKIVSIDENHACAGTASGLAMIDLDDLSEVDRIDSAFDVNCIAFAPDRGVIYAYGHWRISEEERERQIRCYRVEGTSLDLIVSISEPPIIPDELIYAASSGRIYALRRRSASVQVLVAQAIEQGAENYYEGETQLPQGCAYLVLDEINRYLYAAVGSWYPYVYQIGIDPGREDFHQLADSIYTGLRGCGGLELSLAADALFVCEMPPSAVVVKVPVAPGVIPPPGEARYFEIAAPSVVTAGEPFTLSIIARDENERVATGFTGLVELTVTDSQSPFADPIFIITEANRGVLAIDPFVLLTAELHQITVRAIDRPEISGSTLVTVLPGPPALISDVTPEGVATGSTGQTLSFRVTDLFGNAISGTEVRVSFTLPDGTLIERTVVTDQYSYAQIQIPPAPAEETTIAVNFLITSTGTEDSHTIYVEEPPPAPEITRPRSGQTLTEQQNRILVQGRSQPLHEVRIFEAETELGRIRVDEEGNFSVFVGPLFGPRHTIYAVCYTDRGVASERSEPVEFTYEIVPNDPLFRRQHALRRIEVSKAWAYTMGSPQVTVALIDTGVDASHEDLEGQLVPGWDFVNNDDEPEDELGHGTRMAGVIVGLANNGVGIAGVAPGCRVMPLKIFGDWGQAPVEAAVRAVRYAIEHGADVIVFGCCRVSPSDELAEAIRDALAAGIPVIAPAGNGRANIIEYPAACEGVISVTCTDAIDQVSKLGNIARGITIAAPDSGVEATCKGGGYSRALGGTSEPTAIVGGVVALALSVNPSLSPQQIMQIVRYGRDRLWTPIFTDYFGFGRINAGKVLSMACSVQPCIGVGRVRLLPKKPVSRSQARVVMEIENRGIVPLQGGSVEIRIDGELVNAGEVTFPPLDVGQNVTVEAVINIAANEGDGWLDIRLLGSRGESFSGETCRTFLISVASQGEPDIRIDSVRMRQTDAEGRDYEFTVRVINVGVQRTDELQMHCEVSGEVLDPVVIPTLEPGASCDLVVRWVAPEELTRSKRCFKARIDPLEGETQIGDNSISLVFRVELPEGLGRGLIRLAYGEVVDCPNIVADAPWWVRADSPYIPVMLFIPNVELEEMWLCDVYIELLSPTGLDHTHFITRDRCTCRWFYPVYHLVTGGVYCEYCFRIFGRHVFAFVSGPFSRVVWQGDHSYQVPGGPRPLRIVYHDNWRERIPEIRHLQMVVDESGKLVPEMKVATRPDEINEQGARRLKGERDDGWHRIFLLNTEDVTRWVGGRKLAFICVAVHYASEAQVSHCVNHYVYTVVLKVKIGKSVQGMPRFSELDKYYDPHYHTIAEYCESDKSSAPRLAFGGPLQMTAEVAYAFGWSDSRKYREQAGKIITTDHNCFLNDRECPDRGPTGGEAAQEKAKMKELFGDSFGEEVTLKRGNLKELAGGLVDLYLGRHMLVINQRQINTVGPWHGDLLGPLVSDEICDLTVFELKQRMKQPGEKAFGFIAHPRSVYEGGWDHIVDVLDALGIGWWRCYCELAAGPIREAPNKKEINVRVVRTEDGRRQEEFVIKGVQSFNERSDMARARVEGYWDCLNLAMMPMDPDRSWWGKHVEDREAWEEAVSRGLLYSFNNAPGFKFIRKVFTIGGSDAHGDFNFKRSTNPVIEQDQSGGLDPFVRDVRNFRITSNAYGKVRTYCLVNFKPREDKNERGELDSIDSDEPKPGEIGNAYKAALLRLAQGRSIVTDGPIIYASIDVQPQFDSEDLEWNDMAGPDWKFNEDGRIGGKGNLDGGRTAWLPLNTRWPWPRDEPQSSQHDFSYVRYKWISTEDWGIDSCWTYEQISSYVTVLATPIYHGRVADKVQLLGIPPPGHWAFKRLTTCVCPTPSVDPLPDGPLLFYFDGPFSEAVPPDPVAVYFELGVNPPGWNQVYPAYLGYTNPIWLAPVIVSKFGASVRVDHEARKAYLSDLTCYFVFSISLNRAPEARLKLIKGNGKTEGSDVRDVLRVSSFGEANGIERSLLKVGLSQEVELVDSTPEQQLEYDLATRSGGGANRGGSIIFHNAFVLYLVTPEEHNGNRLNSIAVVFDVEAAVPAPRAGE
jgi:thermitase